MATVPTVTVDDPHAPPASGAEHSGDGHHGDVPMLMGHDGQMHPSHLQHFFVSSEQQFEASKLGMWLFLATEILLFGGMFVAYGIFRMLYPELYEAASLQLDTVLGATNTLVLLLSSLTMAWAIRGAQMDNRKVLIGNLIATMVLASGFLVVKYFEYSHKFHEGIYPGINFELRDDTQTVSDLNGATALTPIFTPGRHEDEAHDVGSVESDAGTMTTAEGPLTGEDQAYPPGDATSVPGSPAATGDGPEGDTSPTSEQVDAARTGAQGLAGGSSTVANGRTEDLDQAGVGGAVDRAVRDETRRAALVASTGDQSTEGLETEHGAGERAEAKEAIFHDRRAGIFFSIYYVMTGIHAIHIVIGIIAIGFLTVFSAKGKYSSVWYTPVENVGLYWHIVDIIWIFVFPLMYLI